MRAPRPITLTPAGLVATAAVFLVAAACVRLGFWQLDRLEQRRDANAGLQERLARGPVVLSESPVDTTGLVMRAAEVSGTWDHERSVALAGRGRQGVPGVHVLTPLLTAEGRAVLVDRGFVPSPDAATVAWAAARVTGPATVVGRFRAFSPDLAAEGSLRTPPEGQDALPVWFARSPDGIGAHLPYRVGPLYLVAERSTAAAPYPAPSPPPELDDGPHLGYALQWFSFAVIAVVGWGALVLRGSRLAARARADPSDGSRAQGFRP